MKISAFHKEPAGSELDLHCRTIFEINGGEFLNSGTALETMDRELEYEIPDDKAEAVQDLLKVAGCQVFTGPSV